MQKAFSSNEVLTERQGHVLVVTINRPEAHNAVNLAVSVGIGDALDQADADPDVRAIVITGAGDQAFCAGADLKAFSRGEPIMPMDSLRAGWGFAGIVNHPLSKPIIAAVNGFALGGGTEIALASDIVVASETANFGLPEVRRGIVAAAGGAFRLLAQIPRKTAMEMMLTGEPINAERARALGLVNAVVPQVDVLDHAIAIARKISANAPLAVQATKRIALGIESGVITAEKHAWEITQREIETLLESEDAREGSKAFTEKRLPTWTGK